MIQIIVTISKNSQQIRKVASKENAPKRKKVKQIKTFLQIYPKKGNKALIFALNR